MILNVHFHLVLMVRAGAMPPYEDQQSQGLHLFFLPGHIMVYVGSHICILILSFLRSSLATVSFWFILFHCFFISYFICVLYTVLFVFICFILCLKSFTFCVKIMITSP